MTKRDDYELRDRIRALRRPSNTDPGYPIHAFEDDLVLLIQQESIKAVINELSAVVHSQTTGSHTDQIIAFQQIKDRLLKLKSIVEKDENETK